MSDLKTIPIAQIRVNPEGLRQVDEQNEQFLELVDSVRDRGVLAPILVREMQDGDGSTFYGLIDGLQRYTAATLAGLEEINAHVKSMEDGDVLEVQVIANAVRVETKHAEFAGQVNRILNMNPLLTVTELAGRLNKSPEWLTKIVGLVKLDDQVSKLVDDGSIKLSNAIALSRLPAEEQVNNIEAAMSQPPSEFVPYVANRVKEIRKAKREGRDPKKAEFTPTPHLRKLKELKEELENNDIGPRLLEETGVSEPQGAFNLALQWVLNLDPVSVEAAKAKWEEKQKAAAAKKAAAKEERAKKAAELAKKAQEEAEAAKNEAG